jgi:glycerophosphoryl diester phosphodiesterase
MLVLSHRGYHVQFPENTLEAFEAAAAMGVDGIETDLRLTSDGQLILFHDRLAPDGRAVNEVTRDELRRLVGHDIPLAETALERWPQLLWNLELKTPAARAASLDLISRFQSSHRLLVSSFWHPLVEETARRTEVDCGLLVVHHPSGAPDATAPFALAARDARADSWRRRINTIVWNFEFLDQAGVQAAAEAGYRNFCYGVATPADHETAQQWGLDGIITDRPEFARRWELLPGAPFLAAEGRAT